MLARVKVHSTLALLTSHVFRSVFFLFLLTSLFFVVEDTVLWLYLLHMFFVQCFFFLSFLTSLLLKNKNKLCRGFACFTCFWFSVFLFFFSPLLVFFKDTVSWLCLLHMFFVQRFFFRCRSVALRPQKP